MLLPRSFRPRSADSTPEVSWLHPSGGPEWRQSAKVVEESASVLALGSKEAERAGPRTRPTLQRHGPGNCIPHVGSTS